MMKVKIERTKKGFPALWECGGGFTNTGEATIITSQNGDPKKPVYIRRRGHLANERHALIPVEVGDFIVKANHHREDFEIRVFRIVDFEEDAIIEQVYEFSMNEWDAELPDFLVAAVEAAMQKATCYHCRSPHFIIE